MISEQQLNTIIGAVESKGLSEETVGALRVDFADFHFTYCMDDDMAASEPAMEKDGFNVYFVTSQEHCSKLTHDREIASGLVLAEVLEDDY